MGVVSSLGRKLVVTSTGTLRFEAVRGCAAGSREGKGQNWRAAAAQWNPAPKAVKTTRSPSAILPSC